MQLGSQIPDEQRQWWRIALELRLRQCHGDSFQDLFSVVMGHLHGDDFVRVRAFGKLGDKGCDGYLLSTGQLFQCYGALNGETKNVAKLVKKIKSDFATAKVKLAGITKEWHMVLNLVDGIPVEALEALEELKISNPNIKIGYIGKEGFEERIFELSSERVASLLGPAATPADVKNLDVAALRKLVDDLSLSSAPPLEEIDLNLVPVGKLSHNALPTHWQMFVRSGWANAPIVASYFSRHPDPLKGEQVGALLNEKYRALKAQNLTPGTIMTALLETVTGVGSAPPPRLVAAQALLTHFFESCDIFERLPVASPT
ncbi:ABC-three component system protein [Mitsuaria sp. 7]|uniref:ABC-three component system protein n=1 Tax=Mitsuaria sp. 7 TaxID=1658665 RepID=UPI0007DDEF50|nr:ABC-three component system protein [Mitsuaria sp. 7]ANH69074.1 hypothetical protein ABE85_18575 [Mitsuaria sp. 7]